MAKKQADMRPLTKVLTHINEQTFSANATTLINERIDTPGYGGDFMLANKKERAACLLLAARVWIDPVDNVATIAANAWLLSQITQGDHEVDTALVALTDADLCMHGVIELPVTTSPLWPLDLDPIIPEPLIITRDFTIAHRGPNSVAVNSRKIYTVLTYQVVAVSTEKYADMLLTQQRMS